jgi:hypothetical protein
MFSRVLIPKLNVLDFRVLKGQSQDNICFANFFGNRSMTQ